MMIALSLGRRKPLLTLPFAIGDRAEQAAGSAMSAMPNSDKILRRSEMTRWAISGPQRGDIPTFEKPRFAKFRELVNGGDNGHSGNPALRRPSV